MKRFMLAAAAGAILVSACASDGAQQRQANAAADDDPPVGTLIKRHRPAAARPDAGKIDPQALDDLRNMDNGSTVGR